MPTIFMPTPKGTCAFILRPENGVGKKKKFISSLVGVIEDKPRLVPEQTPHSLSDLAQILSPFSNKDRLRDEIDLGLSAYGGSLPRHREINLQTDDGVISFKVIYKSNNNGTFSGKLEPLASLDFYPGAAYGFSLLDVSHQIGDLSNSKKLLSYFKKFS
jgi:hypothetical protein